MRRMATLAFALLLPPLTALADPSGDYAALVTAAQDGDPGVDFTVMRQAYAQIPEYDPLGAKTADLMRDGEAAYVAKDCKTALDKFKAAIALNFTLSDAHALSADCLEQAGDKKNEAREEAIAQGLFYSIVASGDGKSPETAFWVVTRHEEGVVLAVAGLQGKSRETVSTDHGPVDKVGVRDGTKGHDAAMYFNVSTFAGARAVR
jgi:hypothetical protein